MGHLSSRLSTGQAKFIAVPRNADVCSLSVSHRRLDRDVLALGAFTQSIQSLHALEMFLRFNVSRSPHQNESWLIAAAACRETFPKQASHFMLLCMCRIVGHPINS